MPDCLTWQETGARLIDRWITGRALRTAGFLGFAVFVLLGTATLSRETPDYWQHLSAIRNLSSNLLQPPPLNFFEPYEVHLYTPYHLFWAVALRVLGISLWDIAILMAVVNAGFFVLGARLIAKNLFKEPRLDFVMLVTLLVFWGRPIWWSGVYSLGQLALTAMYPSFFALGGSMIVGALWLEDGYRSKFAWVTFSIAIAALLVTHPITTSFLLLFLFMKTLLLARPKRRELLLSAICVLGGCGLGMLWPYYSLTTLMAAAGSEADFFGDFEAFYSGLPRRLGLEVLGFAALPLVKEARTRRFLGFLLLVLIAIYALNYALHLSHVLSRYLIFITFTLHLSVVAAIGAVRRQRLARIILPVFVILAALGGARQLRIAALTCYGLAQDVAAGVAPGTHSIENRYAEVERLNELDGDGRRVIMAPLDWAYRITALSGLRVVGVLLEAPTMPDYEGRRRDVLDFYDPETPAGVREEIIDRRDVDFILFPVGGEGGDRMISPGWAPVLQGSLFDVYSTRG